MLIKELRDYYVTWTKLTRKLDFGTSVYQNWVKKGYIPYTTQLLIEKRSGGLFKADLAHAKPRES